MIIFALYKTDIAMQRKPESLTFDRMREMISLTDSDMRNDLFISKDLMIVSDGHFVVKSILKAGVLFQLQDYRCGLVQSGRARIRINLIDREMEMGMLAFLTPGTIVQPLETSEDFSLTGMAVSSEMLHLSLNNHLPAIFNGKMMDGRLAIKEDEQDLIRQMFLLLQNVAKREKRSQQVVLNLVSAILNQYDLMFSEYEIHQNTNLSNERYIFDRFIYLVNNNCSREHQMKFYADKMCLTERYLGTVVKRASGVTAKEWIDRAIITTAKLMLKHSDKSAAQIAYELNFPNPSFFSKYFRRIADCTPHEYRNKE